MGTADIRRDGHTTPRTARLCSPREDDIPPFRPLAPRAPTQRQIRSTAVHQLRSVCIKSSDRMRSPALTGVRCAPLQEPIESAVHQGRYWQRTCWT